MDDVSTGPIAVVIPVMHYHAKSASECYLTPLLFIVFEQQK